MSPLFNLSNYSTAAFNIGSASFNTVSASSFNSAIFSLYILISLASLSTYFFTIEAAY